MRLDHVRERLDLERRQLARNGERLEALPDVTRVTRGREHSVAVAALSADTADAAMAREVVHHRTLGVAFEWKLYGHDQPADLRQRLERQGVIAGLTGGLLDESVTRRREDLEPVRHSFIMGGVRWRSGQRRALWARWIAVT
jgi:hypothetical protein